MKAKTEKHVIIEKALCGKCFVQRRFGYNTKEHYIYSGRVARSKKRTRLTNECPDAIVVKWTKVKDKKEKEKWTKKFWQIKKGETK